MANQLNIWHRQTLIKNWNQQKLLNSKITIVGHGPITDYLSAFITGLGIGSVDVFSNNEKPESKYCFLSSNGKNEDVFLNKLKEMQEGMEFLKFSLYLSDISESLIDENTAVIIDATNDPYSKRESLRIAKLLHEKGRMISSVISLSSDDYRSSMLVCSLKEPEINSDMVFETEDAYREGDLVTRLLMQNIPKSHTIDALLEKKKNEKLEDKLEDFCMSRYSDRMQGSFTSCLIAGMGLDETRKSILKLSEADKICNALVNYNVLSNIRTSETDDIKPGSILPLKDKKVLIVGAGGVGTYVALNLALMGVGKIWIADTDSVKMHNRNRQIFYYESVGKPKAQTLASRIKEISPETDLWYWPVFIDEKLADSVREKHYDAIFCCSDKVYTKKFLSDLATAWKKNGENVPIIEGSISSSVAECSKYLPGINYCLECQLSLRTGLELEKKRDEEKARILKEYTGNEHADDDVLMGCASALLTDNVVMTNAIDGAMMAGEALSVLLPDQFPSLLKHQLFYSNVMPVRIMINDSDYKKGHDCQALLASPVEPQNNHLSQNDPSYYFK